MPLSILSELCSYIYSGSQGAKRDKTFKSNTQVLHSRKLPIEFLATSKPDQAHANTIEIHNNYIVVQ